MSGPVSWVRALVMGTRTCKPREASLGWRPRSEVPGAVEVDVHLQHINGQRTAIREAAACYGGRGGNLRLCGL